MARLDSTTIFGSLRVNGDTELKKALKVTGIITGNGSGITSLNANNISTGTVPSDRIQYATDTTRGAVRIELNGDTIYF